VTATIVSASDAAYFDLLKGLVLSIRDKPQGAGVSISILDVGLNGEQRDWLADQGAVIVEPGWDFDMPPAMNTPGRSHSFRSKRSCDPGESRQGLSPRLSHLFP